MTYWEYVYAELQKELSGDCEHLFENTTFDFFNIEQLQNTNDILDDILN
jgi:hypothetical protein